MHSMYSKNHDDLLHDKKIPARISCIKPNGYPLVLSLWYVMKNNEIFCATQKNAKITSYLKKNPLCGFEIAADTPPYRGVRGDGIAEIHDDGAKTLDILIDKYLGSQESNLSKLLRKNSSSEITIKIIPKNIIVYDYSKRMKNVVLRHDEKIMKDDACPTCGSKKFEIITNNDANDTKMRIQLQCNNCKKFWISQN